MWHVVQLAERQQQRVAEAEWAQWHPAPGYDPRTDPGLLADEARYAARQAARARGGDREALRGCHPPTLLPLSPVSSCAPTSGCTAGSCNRACARSLVSGQDDLVFSRLNCRLLRSAINARTEAGYLGGALGMQGVHRSRPCARSGESHGPRR